MKDTFVGDNRGGKIYVILKPFIRELLMMLCRVHSLWYTENVKCFGNRIKT